MAVDDGNNVAASAVDAAPLFSQVQFHIVESEDLRKSRADQLIHVLSRNGATLHPDPEKLSLNGLTHIISTTIDFPDFEAASSLLIPIVKPDWIEASLMKRRLANPRSHSPDPRLFFSGLVVCCADLPSGDKSAIIGGVLAMGGLHSSAVSKMVTHVVALTMDSTQCQTVVVKKLNCKIVLPHWFDDCLKLGKRINETPYLLPNPEILQKGPHDQITDTPRPDLQGASSTMPGRLPTPFESPSSERRKMNVFKDKKVMLSQDLQLGSHLRGTIEDLILKGEGLVTGSIHKADIFICHYREGEDYQTASRARKDVGNLPWLYHLITNNTWTSPFRRLLHYPIAREGLPGFKDFRISLSNYNGEARIYLENLAKAAGCEFTKTMKMDNTHLITAHMISEKCDAAKEWNIHTINHLWLEESYAKWQIQSLSNARYTHFPPRTNLTEVVGRTPIDKESLERVFFPKLPDAVVAAQESDLPQPMQQRDRNISSNNVSNRSAVHPSSSGISDDHSRSRNDDSTPRGPKQGRRHSEGAALRTPSTAKYVAEGKENETPSTTGSRRAKDRAVARLHSLGPDIALYEKEKKRAGGVVFGGRKNGGDDLVDANWKRSISGDGDGDIGADREERDAKRPKKSKGLPEMRLLLSGYQRWVGNLKRENEDKSRLRELGISVVNDPFHCTHLAAPRILRTQKFICALAHGPVILSTDFVDECLLRNEAPKPENFLLKDVDGEKHHCIKIVEVTKRAKANKGQLLQGDAVYVTENINGGFETYKSIIEANGGKCVLYRGRAGSVTSRSVATDNASKDKGRPGTEEVYLISGHSQDEVRLWTKFQRMVEASGQVSKIVKTDWVLDLALSQEIKWDDTYEITSNGSSAA